MENLREQVAYLQGLTEGLDMMPSTKEGRVLNSVVSVLVGLADVVEEVRTSQVELAEYLEAMDVDLSDLEDETCRDDDANEIDYVELECPACHETVFLDQHDLAGVAGVTEDIEFTCPSCGEVVLETVETQVENNIKPSGGTLQQKKRHGGI